MVIIASFKANFWYAFFTATILVSGAAYTLWMIKRILYGEVATPQVATLTDLNRREYVVLGVLALSVLLLGLWPAPLVDMMSATLQQLVEQVSQSKLAAL
jgi:NADH-quinone oxidoreductase subunit M